MKGVSASRVTAALCALLFATEIVSGLMCTADVKPCPDGSYVGREGPNCDFAACPSSNSPGSGSRGVFCSADARVCPDGSYVGRVAPNCEFQACNGTQTNNGTSNNNNNNNNNNEVTTPSSNPVPSPSQSAAITVVGSIIGAALTAVTVVIHL